MADQKKFLDYEGVKYLWSKINMQDYPNNETLMGVIEAIDETKADKNELVQSDWNENDETSLAYIKNRTHYDGIKEKIIYTNTLSWELQSNNCYEIYQRGGLFTLEDGVQYKIDLGEEIFIGIAQDVGSDGVICSLAGSKGNSAHMENHYIMIMNNASYRPLDNFTLNSCIPVFKQLDEKFIPDAIARIDNIPQTDWNQNDETQIDYIKNRPFYEVPEIWTILDVIDDGGERFYLDYLLELDKPYTVRIDGIIYSFDCLKQGEYHGASGFYPWYLGAKYHPMYTINWDYPFTIFSMGYKGPREETYILFEDGSPNHIVEFLESKGEIHHINPKYIKDIYYETEPVETEILPEFTIEDIVNDYVVAEDFLEIMLQKDKTYVVTWNDEKYICKTNIDKAGEVYIGNQSIAINGAGAPEEIFDKLIDSSEPFFIVSYEPDAFSLVVAESGSHTFSISIVEQNIHQIQSKYVGTDWNQSSPEGVGYINNRPFYDDMRYVPKTVSQIRKIIEDAGHSINLSFPQLVDDITFRVVIDGKIYDDVPVYVGCYIAGGTTWGIGDIYSDRSWKTTDYGFCCHGYGGAHSNEDFFPNGIENYEIYSLERELKQIDPKYIPDSVLANPDWNQNDENTNDYIKNRPFYENKNIYFKNTVTVGKYGYCEVNGNNSLQFLENISQGMVYNILINDEEYTDISYDAETENQVDFKDSEGNRIVSVQTNKSGEALGWIFFHDNYYPEGSNISVELYKHFILKIDEKYLPDSLFNALDEINVTAETALTTAVSKMNAENPIGTGSFSMNRRANTNIGDYSHAEGYNTEASGDYSHAEGYNTEAFGANQNVIGKYNIKNGKFIEAIEELQNFDVWQNYKVKASTEYSFDSNTGIFTLVSPKTYDSGASVGIGYYVIEGRGSSESGTTMYKRTESTTSMGGQIYIFVGDKYYAQHINNECGTYAHVVGNGTSNTERSNAHTIDWNGNAWFQGNVYVSSTSGIDKDEGSKKLATEEYVDMAIANKVTIPQDAVAGDLLTYDGTNWVRISKADLIADILLAMEESNKITFYINDEEYHADKNMTWHDWCNSNYNTSNFGNYYEAERVSDADDHIIYEDEFVYGSDIIIANYKYTVRFDPTVDV